MFKSISYRGFHDIGLNLSYENVYFRWSVFTTQVVTLDTIFKATEGLSRSSTPSSQTSVGYRYFSQIMPNLQKILKKNTSFAVHDIINNIIVKC